MKRIALPMLASVLVLSACSSDTPPAPAAAPSKPAASTADTPKVPTESAQAPSETPTAPAETPQPPAKVDMDAAIKELFAKPEEPVEEIEIQHILISFQGAPRMPPSVTRTKEEAKLLAEKVYAEVIGGGDFDAAVKLHTNDSAPGIYPLNQMSRKGMVKSFGDVGWRLKVGEIGVGPWDAKASPFGWHIIKRLK
jgi:hypothetical protein